MQIEKSQVDNKPREGWTWLLNSRKWHYFLPNGMSLCGRFFLFKPKDLEQTNDDSPDNCAACRKKLLKRS